MRNQSINRSMLIAAGSAVLLGGMKAARDQAVRKSVVNLLDPRSGQGSEADDLMSRPIVQHPLPAGARTLGKLMARIEVGPADVATQLAPKTAPVGKGILRVFMGVPARGVRITNRTIPGRDGDIPVRVYTPARAASAPRPLVIEFHGGGWSVGDLDGVDWLSSTVARDLDAIVMSVDYRLSPLHPFPAGVNDCFDALKWAAAHMDELGATAGRIGVMGESAGGNLAAVVSLLARHEGGPHVHHQALIYPSVDLAEEPRSHEFNADAPVLNRKAMRAFTRSYVGARDAAKEWRLSPLRAPDKTGLPPALIQIAGHDPLYDEGLNYAEALAKAGVPVRLTAYAAMPHGYVNMPYFCRDAKAAVQEVVAQQRLYLSVA